MTQQTYSIDFRPNPLQRKFIESRASADLFSSRMGEGKSTAIAWAVFYHTRHNPGARWAIIRDTWENLRGTTMQTFFEWFPPGIFGSWKATDKTFTWADGVAQGEVLFLGMDDPQDASKLMSRELAGFAIDEPAPATGSYGVDEMIFDIGMTRLRQPGMNWYAVKLAENNPDENHWTYRKFVHPGTEGYEYWQPDKPENEENLPEGYYENMRKQLGHRPDLVRRFVEGEFGYQQEGKAVTPQWSDKLHLATGLYPVEGRDLYLGFDMGHNPTCIITQLTPQGYWNILESYVGEDIGMEELLGDIVRPVLKERYSKWLGSKKNNMKPQIRNVGDPAGQQREQTSIRRTPVQMIRSMIGGTWQKGPQNLEDRLEPLRMALSRTVHGEGMVQVDRHRASDVWQALRGEWHFHIARTGLVSPKPVKNHASHPGDAMSYLAAVLFPQGRLTGSQGSGTKEPSKAGYFKSGPLGMGFPHADIPPEGRKIG